MALPLYALTLFVSAFILFLVQPIVGKIILPKLGGTPQVWNTCMVFFQMVLLAGYAYTHNASTRFTLRQQLIAHLGLLCLPLVVLVPFPFALGGEFSSPGVPNPHSLWGFMPDLGSNPIPSTLSVLFVYVALPFLVVSTTAPLLQKWFVYTGHPASKDPYFLYGASNFGSMLSLIVYPFLIEPYVSLKDQGWVYTWGYLALTLFVLACAAMVWNASEPKTKTHEPKPEPKPEPAPAATATTHEPQTGITASAPAVTGVKPGQPGKQPGKPGIGKGLATEPAISHAPEQVTGARRLRWILLATIPSSLMLGITTHITTDLSPIPLFWLIPLILYLGSFILVFARWPVVWTEQPHVYFLWAQPFFIALMLIVDVLHLFNDTRFLAFAIFAHVMGFFTTTMVCHGELAKDRPSTRFLTEFYLCMSVGGMLGGVFNGLIAPIIFPKLWELPLCIFAASFLRPKMFEAGFLDNWLASLFEGKPEAAKAKPGPKSAKPLHTGEVLASESFISTLDYVWPVGILILTGGLLFALSTNAQDSNESLRNTALDYSIPLLIACAALARPIRLGLSLGVVILIFNVLQHTSDASIDTKRSYFGAMSVKQYDRHSPRGPYRQLIHGHIDHGMNFVVPDKAQGRGDPAKDWSRLATTYYHREGPAGRVMELRKFNCFPDCPVNTYWADVRMPVTLIGNLAMDLGMNPFPLHEMTALWCEPPFATVGLGTGTMASYGRPYQHVHFYEIDDTVRRFSLGMPTNKIQTFKQYEADKDQRRPTHFNYLERAIERGCQVQVLMGDARLRMALPYVNHYEKDAAGNFTDHVKPGGGPKNFYHMMVVDAFSSDAIPAHLLTEEAFKMYFDRLVERKVDKDGNVVQQGGILCVHTSNRFVDLPKVVSAVADKLKFAHLRGHDNNDVRGDGHYTSEWVMVARHSDDLAHLSADPFLVEYDKAVRARNKGVEKYWAPVRSDKRYVWTDDYYNMMSVIRFGFGSRRSDD